MHDLNRRDFVKTTAALLGAAAIPTLPSIATAANPTAGKDVLRVLQVGVGGIGGMDRNAINRHPKAKIVGLCDVDQNPLDKVGKQFPDAFTETDYRKVFADRLDEFDAVNVCTPDHSHIAPMLLALANDKHCYGQKPLVQQLDEIVMLEKAVAAKPHLATNTGNQRMQNKNRRIAVDILGRGLLGKAIAGKLAAAGCEVVLTARGESDLEATADHLRSTGATVTAIPADLTDSEERKRLIDAVRARTGGVDILVNNAGSGTPARFADTDLGDLQHLVELDLVAPIHLTQLVLPAMLNRGRGNIVNISSIVFCSPLGVLTWPSLFMLGLFLRCGCRGMVWLGGWVEGGLMWVDL